MNRRFSILIVFLFLLNSNFEARVNDDRGCTTSYCDKFYKLHHCPPSSCGKIRKISHPFRLKTDPKKCGHKDYTLSCQNHTTKLSLFSEDYIVEAIDYTAQTVRVVDPNIQKGNCSSLPRYSLAGFNFTHKVTFEINQNDKSLVFMRCENEIIESSSNNSLYVDVASCGSTWPKRPYRYVLVDGGLSVATMADSCSVELMAVVSGTGIGVAESFEDVHNALAHGFELSWSRAYKLLFEYDESYYSKFQAIAGIIVGIIVSKLMYGSPILAVYSLYLLKRRNDESTCSDQIEQFLRSFNDLMPMRYSYSKLIKMGKGFKNRLGQGGYGTVYKGKLSSGRLVAIKMLGNNKSKANGEEFINEVATIGRIHHVNIVQLIGFCAQGSTRALVYEYMPMGSLDKHLFSDKLGHDNSTIIISCEKMFEISLGVARGIEYLHRGCEIQILHFDIKPHNILLDENFVPKISDFGLARLCPVDNSLVSLTAARGTLGYIAPELVYKNVGGVSNKADVYSFGMLLMEMASRRKNLNAVAERTSQIYFPSWVYDKFRADDKNLPIGADQDMTEEDSKIVKKMVIVALFCIQLNPNDRPSMNKVIEMLECDIECLEMPSKPSLCP